MKTETEKQQQPGEAEAEARRLLELIHFLARTLGFNNAKLARRSNVPLATLVRYFKGEGEPKLEFLISLVRTMGLEVREFIELAYPAPAGPSPARLKIERLLQQIQPPGRAPEPAPPPQPEPKPEGSSREELEKVVADLRRELREMIEHGGRPAEAAKPAAAGKPARARKGKATAS